MTDEKDKPPTEEPISPEQMKFLVKTLWKCLSAPSWKKDDLIDLGKAIFAKKTLKTLDDKVYDVIWPHLKVMAETLDATLTEEAVRISAEAIENAEKTEEKIDKKVDEVETKSVEDQPADDTKNGEAVTS